jgi:hypothetical protein
LRDDGVDIDLLSHEKIEEALKYLKNNKAARAISFAAELMKNSAPNRHGQIFSTTIALMDYYS